MFLALLVSAAVFLASSNITCRTVWPPKAPRPSPSLPSQPSFDNMQEIFDYLLDDAPPGHRTSKMKVGLASALQIPFLTACPGQALIRDGHRCILTT